MSTSTILSDNGVSSGTSGIKTSGGNVCAVYWLRLNEHSDMFTQGYIGVSKKAKFRWNQHLVKGQNNHLQNAINKYGWNNIVKQIILIADRNYCLDIEKKLRPNSKIGWNIAIGGGNPPTDYGVKFKKGDVSWKKGLVTPEDTRKKISESLKGRSMINAGSFAKGKIPWNKGIPMPDEVKEKVSKSKKGTKLSEVTKARMSASRIGKTPYKMTDEIKAKISAGLKKWNLENSNKKEQL